MPVNSDYDGFFSDIGGVPLFTYGMITATIFVLSYMTIMEADIPPADEVVEGLVETTDSSLMTATTPIVPPASLTEEVPLEEVPEEALEEALEEVPSEEVPEEPKIGGKTKKKRNTKRKRPIMHRSNTV